MKNQLVHYRHTLQPSITSPVEKRRGVSQIMMTSIRVYNINHAQEMTWKPHDRFRGLTVFNCHL